MKLRKMKINSDGYHAVWLILAGAVVMNLIVVVGTMTNFTFALTTAATLFVLALLGKAVVKPAPKYNFKAWNQAIDKFIDSKDTIVPKLTNYQTN